MDQDQEVTFSLETCFKIISSVLAHYTTTPPQHGDRQLAYMNKLMFALNKMHERIMALESYKAAYEQAMRERHEK